MLPFPPRRLNLAIPCRIRDVVRDQSPVELSHRLSQSGTPIRQRACHRASARRSAGWLAVPAAAGATARADAARTDNGVRVVGIGVAGRARRLLGRAAVAAASHKREAAGSLGGRPLGPAPAGLARLQRAQAVGVAQQVERQVDRQGIAQQGDRRSYDYWRPPWPRQQRALLTATGAARLSEARQRRVRGLGHLVQPRRAHHAEPHSRGAASCRLPGKCAPVESCRTVNGSR